MKLQPSEDLCKPTIMTLIGWLKDELPCAHIRFADGEYNAITGLIDKRFTNCDGHNYFIDMGIELKRVLYEISKTNRSRLQVGGYWNETTYPILEKMGVMDNIKWVPSQCFVSSIITMLSLDVLRAIRDSKYPKIFIANQKVQKAAQCLNASYVSIAEKNSWLDTPRIEKFCETVNPNTIFIWCAGMPSKVWAWDTWSLLPNTTHLDMGHFFDGAFNVYSRSWLEDRNNERWRCYAKYYIPFIKGECK